MERIICTDSRIIHTIGHSTRSTESFLALLHAHAITCVVDVRRWPASRRHPHFAREPLSAALASVGIRYVWRQDLGGYRTPSSESPNTGWRIGSFRAYADFLLTTAFESAIAELEELGRRPAHRPDVRRGASLALSPPAPRRRLHRARLVGAPHPRHRLRRAPAPSLRPPERDAHRLSRKLGAERGRRGGPTVLRRRATRPTMSAGLR